MLESYSLSAEGACFLHPVMHHDGACHQLFHSVAFYNNFKQVKTGIFLVLVLTLCLCTSTSKPLFALRRVILDSGIYYSITSQLMLLRPACAASEAKDIVL